MLLALTTPATGHDLWLIPSEKAEPGKTSKVLANSGMDFPQSESAPDPAKFAMFRLRLPDGMPGNLKADGKDGKSGVLSFNPEKPGLYIVAVETAPKIITLDAKAFNEYLVSDGLPHIYRLRAKENSLDKEGKERYSKSPKALIQVGKGGEGDCTKPLGLPLEIIPLNDPFALKVDQTLKVRVLFNGKPLADANLGWDLPDDGDLPTGTARTDAKGEALIPIARTGLMTIRLTHMTRPKAADYEWESFWTTLTFRIPE